MPSNEAKRDAGGAGGPVRQRRPGRRQAPGGDRRAFLCPGRRRHRVVDRHLLLARSSGAGLRITTRPADEDYPYGYGKAETLAAAVVSLMLLGAAARHRRRGRRARSSRRTTPRPRSRWSSSRSSSSSRRSSPGGCSGSATRRAARRSRPTPGTTGATRSPRPRPSSASPSPSGAAPAGSRPTTGRPWSPPRIIAVNGVLAAPPGDPRPDGPDARRAAVEQIAAAAEGVEGVRAIEKLRVRRLGTEYFVDLHVQADPTSPPRRPRPERQGQGGDPLGGPAGRRCPDPHGAVRRFAGIRIASHGLSRIIARCRSLNERHSGDEA